MTDGHVYFARHGDREIILQRIEYYKSLTDEELKEESIRKRKLGFVGAHRQALEIIAFHNVMKQRFGDSPIHIEGNSILSLKEDVQQNVESDSSTKDNNQ